MLAAVEKFYTDVVQHIKPWAPAPPKGSDGSAGPVTVRRAPGGRLTSLCRNLSKLALSSHFICGDQCLCWATG